MQLAVVCRRHTQAESEQRWTEEFEGDRGRRGWVLEQGEVKAACARVECFSDDWPRREFQERRWAEEGNEEGLWVVLFVGRAGETAVRLSK